MILQASTCFAFAVFVSCINCLRLTHIPKSKNAIPFENKTIFDYKAHRKLPYQEKGYQEWIWNGHSINYVDVGGEEENDHDNKPPLLLKHGFGASVFHWRYNVPYLARRYRVYALDLLGFEMSDKPLLDYSAELWRDQVLDFIREVVMKGPTKGSTSDKIIRKNRYPCVVAGNSLGGFTALYAASSPAAVEDNLVSGCIEREPTPVGAEHGHRSAETGDQPVLRVHQAARAHRPGAAAGVSGGRRQH